MITPSYTYRAHVERVIDGDTIDVAIDLGFSTWRRGERLRLLNVRAPEMTGPDKKQGKLAKETLAGLLKLGTQLVVETHKDEHDKYGRMLAEVYLWNGDSVNEYMRTNAPTGGK